MDQCVPHLNSLANHQFQALHTTQNTWGEALEKSKTLKEEYLYCVYVAKSTCVDSIIRCVDALDGIVQRMKRILTKLYSLQENAIQVFGVERVGKALFRNTSLTTLCKRVARIVSGYEQELIWKRGNVSLVSQVLTRGEASGYLTRWFKEMHLLHEQQLELEELLQFEYQNNGVLN